MILCHVRARQISCLQGMRNGYHVVLWKDNVSPFARHSKVIQHSDNRSFLVLYAMQCSSTTMEQLKIHFIELKFGFSSLLIYKLNGLVRLFHIRFRKKFTAVLWQCSLSDCSSTSQSSFDSKVIKTFWTFILKLWTERVVYISMKNKPFLLRLEKMSYGKIAR